MVKAKWQTWNKKSINNQRRDKIQMTTVNRVNRRSIKKSPKRSKRRQAGRIDKLEIKKSRKNKRRNKIQTTIESRRSQKKKNPKRSKRRWTGQRVLTSLEGKIQKETATVKIPNDKGERVNRDNRNQIGRWCNLNENPERRQKNFKIIHKKKEAKANWNQSGRWHNLNENPERRQKSFKIIEAKGNPKNASQLGEATMINLK